MVPLLQAVADPTGKEDMLAALRKALLLRLAAQLGCNKVAIGTSATRMAVRTVAMSAKGSGFALSGATHFTDSRSVHALPRLEKEDCYCMRPSGPDPDWRVFVIMQ